MRNKSCFIILTIVVATISIALANNSSLIPSVDAQGAGDAYFTGVEYSLKIYQWTEDKWNFTVYNEDCSVDIWDRAWFFFKFYLNGSLWWDEYQETGTWRLDKGSSATKTYTVSLGSGPAIKDVKIELYWDYEGTPYLQDTISFSEKIVKVFVDDWSSSSLTVEKGKTTASTLTVSIKNGGNDDMYATKIAITDSASLEITPQLQNLGNITSGGAKSTSFSVTAPSAAALGVHILSFEISYNDFREVFHTETKTASIEVDKLGTNIEITLQPSTLKIGSSTTITAKLTDENNIALANEEISFSVGTTSIGSSLTDSSGKAIETYTANHNAGTHVIKASYGGNSDCAQCNATSNLMVNPLDTNLTIDIPSATQGKECTLVATLKDEEGSPMQNIDIDFYICGTDCMDWIGTAKTDSSGVASLKYTPSTTGTFQVKALFAGTTNYAESNSTRSALYVAMDYTLFYIGGGITAVAIIGIVGYIIFRKKKTPSSPK